MGAHAKDHLQPASPCENRWKPPIAGIWSSSPPSRIRAMGGTSSTSFRRGLALAETAPAAWPAQEGGAWLQILCDHVRQRRSRRRTQAARTRHHPSTSLPTGCLTGFSCPLRAGSEYRVPKHPRRETALLGRYRGREFQFGRRQLFQRYDRERSDGLDG